MQMRFVFLLLLAVSTVKTFAHVDTVNVFSAAMQKNIRCVVITPDNYSQSQEPLPVVYLLHGHGGSYSNWIRRVPAIDSLADVYNLIIVCPDAASSSWYFDSPVDSSFRYETFTAKELPRYIDSKYRTIATRKGRAITGLSMGGHGAFFLALRHPQTFGACGSMSGALDITLIKGGFHLPNRLGDTVMNVQYYSNWSVLNMLDHYDQKDSLEFILDCGTKDFIFDMSQAAHEKMTQRKIPHDYIERPGKHDWNYWANAVKYQLLFFREWFNRNM